MRAQNKPTIEIGDTKKIDWVPSPWDGISYKWIRIGPDGANVVDLLRLGKGVTLLPHRHSSAQTSYMIKGNVRTLDGSEMSTGSWIYIPPGLRHGHTATEETIWVDFFPGMLTWWLDDGSVFNLKSSGEFAKLGTIERLGERSMM